MIATRARRWLSPLLLAYLLISAAFITSVVMIQASKERAENRLCEALEANRQVLRDVVVTAYQPTGGGGFDLTALPSYAQLPPETQAWVDDLQAALSASSSQRRDDGDGNGIPDRIDEVLARPACDNGGSS